MNTRQYIGPALLAGALLLPSLAMAQQQPITANLEVSIKINAVCTLNTASLAFADQTGLEITGNVDNNATVTVNCTNTAPYTLGFGLGNNNAGSRRMTDGNSNFITYEIYRDAAHTEVLAALGETYTIGGTGNGLDQSLTVYGRVPPQTATATGTYTDQVVMTLEY